MKNYEEMAESVLERRDRYVADRKRKMREAASVVSCFCFIAVLGTGIWYAGILNHDRGISDGQPKDAVNDGYPNTEALAGGILPGGATIGDAMDSGDDIKKEMQQPAEYELGEGLEGKQPQTIDASSQSDEIIETDLLDTSVGIDVIGVDKPVVENPGNTGALTAYEAVWGGSYPNEAGQWVVLLTENTAENQKKVFDLNPSLTENNTIFQSAAYSLAYLTDLMERISQAIGSNGEISFVSSIGLREEKNCIQVTVITDDSENIEKILAFDTIGGAIEIICLSDFQPNENIIK